MRRARRSKSRRPLWAAPPMAVATLRSVVDAVWQEGYAPAGETLTPRRLRLRQGLAEIQFACRATAILKAPADLELVGAAAAFLHSGQMVVRVPHDRSAANFRVETPTSQLIDKGTEFGVEIDEGGLFPGAGVRRRSAGHGQGRQPSQRAAARVGRSGRATGWRTRRDGVLAGTLREAATGAGRSQGSWAIALQP